MTITQINKQYVAETINGRIHILNRKSLIWNMKYVFNLKGKEGMAVMKRLDLNGYVEVVAAA